MCQRHVTDHRRPAFPLAIALVGTVVIVRKVGVLQIIANHRRQLEQNISICPQRDADWSLIAMAARPSQTLPDHVEIRLNHDKKHNSQKNLAQKII